MRFLTFFAVALPALAAAIPTVIPRWKHGDDDTMILNFELSLAQLASAFYDEGLCKFDDNGFRSAGLPDFARGRFREIQQHEHDKTAFLAEAIRESGADTANTCKYKLYVADYMRTYLYFLTFSIDSPLDSAAAFARASLDISTIVEAAYNGALGCLNNKDYRIVNGQIASAEARQAAWVNSALFKKNPWNTAFDTALTFRQAWTAIGRYVESCPPENEELVPPQSINAFPSLEIVGILVHGQRGQVRFPGVEDCERRGLFVVFKTGLQELRAKLSRDGFFEVPAEVVNTGANFIFVTSNDILVTDENIVAGPTIYQFDFDSGVCFAKEGELGDNDQADPGPDRDGYGGDSNSEYSDEASNSEYSGEASNSEYSGGESNSEYSDEESNNEYSSGDSNSEYSDGDFNGEYNGDKQGNYNDDNTS
jgi:hypothetical protein